MNRAKKTPKKKAKQHSRQRECPVFVQDRALFCHSPNGKPEQMYWCELPPLKENSLYANGFSCDVCEREFEAVPFWHSFSADCCKECSVRLRLEAQAAETEVKLFSDMPCVCDIWLPSRIEDVTKHKIVCGYCCQRRVLCLLHRSGETAVAMQNESETEFVRFWSMRSSARTTSEHRAALQMPKKKNAQAKCNVVVRMFERGEFEKTFPHFTSFFRRTKIFSVFGAPPTPQLQPNRLPDILASCSFELLWSPISDADEEFAAFSDVPPCFSESPGRMLFLHSDGGIQIVDAASGILALFGGRAGKSLSYVNFELCPQPEQSAVNEGLRKWAREVLSLLGELPLSK